MQIPNLPNYVQVPQQPNYNAVKIDIVNPMVNVPPVQQYPGQVQYPVQPQNSQYAVPTVPIYNYPQVQTQPYCVPQAVAPQPQMVAPQPQAQMPQMVPQQIPPMAVYPNAPAVEIPLQPQAVPPAPVVMTQPKADNNQQPVAEKPVDVVPPQEIKPQVDLNEFLAKLTNPNFEIQAAAMEEIANMVDTEPKKAENLLDTQVIKALNDIIQKDTSALEGPTAEQEALRQKLFNNETLSDAEKTLALTMTPKEQAERNKSYAIFTTAITAVFLVSFETSAIADVMTRTPGTHMKRPEQRNTLKHPLTRRGMGISRRTLPFRVILLLTAQQKLTANTTANAQNSTLYFLSSPRAVFMKLPSFFSIIPRRMINAMITHTIMPRPRYPKPSPCPSKLLSGRRNFESPKLLKNVLRFEEYPPKPPSI